MQACFTWKEEERQRCRIRRGSRIEVSQLWQVSERCAMRRPTNATGSEIGFVLSRGCGKGCASFHEPGDERCGGKSAYREYWRGGGTRRFLRAPACGRPRSRRG